MRIQQTTVDSAKPESLCLAAKSKAGLCLSGLPVSNSILIFRPEIHVNTALDKLQNSIEPTTIHWDVIFKNYYSNANKCLFRLHYFTFLTFF